MTAATDFAGRYTAAQHMEIALKTRLGARQWEVRFDGVERRYGHVILAALHKHGINLCGPDLMAARDGEYWAIDVKTALQPHDQHLPGMGKYTISTKAISAMTHWSRALFALGDSQEWMFVTPQEVLKYGRRSYDGSYWIVSATDGTPMDIIFGVTDDDPEFAGEYPGDFPLAA